MSVNMYLCLLADSTKPGTLTLTSKTANTYSYSVFAGSNTNRPNYASAGQADSSVTGQAVDAGVAFNIPLQPWSTNAPAAPNDPEAAFIISVTTTADADPVVSQTNLRVFIQLGVQTDGGGQTISNPPQDPPVKTSVQLAAAAAARLAAMTLKGNSLAVVIQDWQSSAYLGFESVAGGSYSYAWRARSNEQLALQSGTVTLGALGSGQFWFAAQRYSSQSRGEPEGIFLVTLDVSIVTSQVNLLVFQEISL